jgi:iron complex transport system ATP-binding protein
VTAVLAFQGLSVFRGRRKVLRDLSLTLKSGEIWALIGPNGSGKSTLLASLIGAVTASGEVRHRGENLLALSARERARRITLTGRELGADAPITARAWVELGRLPYVEPWRGLAPDDERAVDAALREAQASALAERRLGTLSDGERQRVYFARALAQSADVLLLDEATAHLDLAQREELLGRVRTYVGRERTALLAVHDLELAARHCSHVAVLDAGALVAAGELAATLTPRLMAEVFHVDARLEADDRGPMLRVYGTARNGAESGVIS